MEQGPEARWTDRKPLRLINASGRGELLRATSVLRSQCTAARWTR